MNEEWRDIKGYEGLYQVSSLGRVRRASKTNNVPAGFILKGKIDSDGYLTFALCKKRKFTYPKVSRLVAIAFHGDPPFPRAQAAHDDGDKTNNTAANVIWKTPSENALDRKRHGTMVTVFEKGSKHIMAKLNEEIVGQMRTRVARGCSWQDEAKLYNVGLITAYQAITGKTWSHVMSPPPVVLKKRNLA